jgi:hypothetical protein
MRRQRRQRLRSRRHSRAASGIGGTEHEAGEFIKAAAGGGAQQ